MDIIFAQPAWSEISFSSFYFWLKFLLGFSIFLFRLDICAEKRCSICHWFYTILYSFPILCKDFIKVSDIMDVRAKTKKRIHYWWCYTVYNFIPFGHEDLRIFLMICRFIFFPCWNSLLVSFFCMLAADPFRVLHQLSYLMV